MPVAIDHATLREAYARRDRLILRIPGEAEDVVPGREEEAAEARPVVGVEACELHDRRDGLGKPDVEAEPDPVRGRPVVRHLRTGFTRPGRPCAAHRILALVRKVRCARDARGCAAGSAPIAKAVPARLEGG